MRRILTLGALLLLTPCVGCAAFPRGTPESVVASLAGDIEIRGRGTATWPDGVEPEEPNFVWEYETVAWRKGEARPVHRMVTKVSLLYDPEAREVRTASISSSEGGHAFRHVCLTPGPNGLLFIRMATLLDDRGRDLTVVKVHGPDPSTHTCEDIGVGPDDGLMEGIDVLFKEDGTFKVIPGTNAYLAGSDIRLNRTATLDPGLAEKQELSLPR